MVSALARVDRVIHRCENLQKIMMPPRLQLPVGRPYIVLEWRTVSPKPHSNLISIGRPKTMMIILVAAEYHTTVESMPTYLNEPEPS